MIRRPPRSTLDRSSAASDVYKRQGLYYWVLRRQPDRETIAKWVIRSLIAGAFVVSMYGLYQWRFTGDIITAEAVSYTHLRAHETVLDLVCRLLLEKKKIIKKKTKKITKNY